jgi:flagellar basal-body rod modification protein FlgD
MPTDSISAATSSNVFANLGQQSRIPVTTLDQNDFLKLLVTQMTTQDPMNPMEDLTSISQMASFSALEQSKATQASMAMLQANSMLGNFVQVTDEKGNVSHGQVEQVQMIKGVPQLVINGERYTLNQVSVVSATPFPGRATPGTTPTPTPNPNSANPQLGPAPRVDVGPVLGTAPSAPVEPTTGLAALLQSAGLLGTAPRL